MSGLSNLLERVNNDLVHIKFVTGGLVSGSY